MKIPYSFVLGSVNTETLHVIDPGLVAAFQGDPDRDVGRKLETTLFLHVRRERNKRRRSS